MRLMPANNNFYKPHTGAFFYHRKRGVKTQSRRPHSAAGGAFLGVPYS
jgi:hypothetical protein